MGSIPEVSAFPATVKESEIIGDATIIPDKGFPSDGNIDGLEKGGLKYLIPLETLDLIARQEKKNNAAALKVEKEMKSISAGLPTKSLHPFPLLQRWRY